jgi:hypothetical protein
MREMRGRCYPGSSRVSETPLHNGCIEMQKRGYLVVIRNPVVARLFARSLANRCAWIRFVMQFWPRLDEGVMMMMMPFLRRV